MSDATRARFSDAFAAHLAERQEAALSGQDPDLVDRDAVDAAAQAHLADVDPGYLDREGGKAPADRQVVPEVKAAYDKALAAYHDDLGSAAKARRAQAAGDDLEAARQAARVLEGRPMKTQLEG